MRVLGFMSGTSLDAVDMAVLETDGVAILGFGPAGERKLSPQTRAVVQDATDQARRDRKSTRLNSSHRLTSRMPSSA